MSRPIDYPPPGRWASNAACSYGNKNVDFFPEKPETRNKSSDAIYRNFLDVAKKICDTCPVKDPCLKYALDNKIPFGVWGGTSPDERKAKEFNSRTSGKNIDLN